MSLCLIMAALPNERPLIVDQTCPPPSADNDEDDDDDDVNDDDDDDDIYNDEVYVCVFVTFLHAQIARLLLAPPARSAPSVRTCHLAMPTIESLL